MSCLAQDREVVAGDVDDLAVVAQVVPAGAVRQRCTRERCQVWDHRMCWLCREETDVRCTHWHPSVPNAFPLIPDSRSERLSSM